MKQKRIYLFLWVIGAGLAGKFIFSSGLRFGSDPLEKNSEKHTPASPSPGAITSPADSKEPALGQAKTEAQSPEVGSPTLTPEDSRKLQILSEILGSKNDNDPRMDTELRNLSPLAKKGMREKYSATRPEKRNERGTTVFLIGREIMDSTDVQFLATVLMEKPCLSLQDCTKDPTAHSGEDEHLDAINETTANYPQLVAIRALKRRGQELIDAGQESGPLFASIREALEAARNSPNPRVIEETEKALMELKHES